MRSAHVLACGISASILAACVSVPPCPVSGIAALRCTADRGSKTAQLELGKAYEAGEGVPIDYKRAAALYRAAASPVSGITYVYSPPVGKSRGQVIPIRTGTPQTGLAEAKYRLGLLYRSGRGVKQNLNRAQALLAAAAVEGFTDR